MPPPPWWEDVSAGVREGDLAAPDVQHLQHGLTVQLVSGKGQSFYQGEAEDGEGHDRQGDGEDHTPEGKSCHDMVGFVSMSLEELVEGDKSKKYLRVSS